MKRFCPYLTLALGLFVAPAVALAETWTNVSIVDVNCSAKVAANPDAHTRDCALQCAKSGYGIVTPEGKYLKLDAEGTKRAYELLKSSDRKDHLRVTLSGALADGTIQVTAIELAPLAP